MLICPPPPNNRRFLKDTRHEEKMLPKLNNSQISVTTTNINTKDTTESSDIASRPDVDTHVDTTKRNLPHNVTPKENTHKESKTCVLLIIDAHLETNNSDEFRNIACPAKVGNKTTNSTLANTMTSFESRDMLKIHLKTQAL